VSRDSRSGQSHIIGTRRVLLAPVTSQRRRGTKFLSEDIMSHVSGQYTEHSHRPTWLCFQRPCADERVGFHCKADLERHSMAYHAPAARFDCGSPLCHRKGCAGFTRRDKMLEHERERHGLRSERSETEGVEIQSSSTGGGGLLYHLNDGYVPRADDQSEETRYVIFVKRYPASGQYTEPIS